MIIKLESHILGNKTAVDKLLYYGFRIVALEDNKTLVLVNNRSTYIADKTI